MKRLKTWLIKEFLPAYAKDTLLKEARLLAEENKELRHKIAERDSYIEGLERGIRNQRSLYVVNNIPSYTSQKEQKEKESGGSKE